MSYIDEQNRIGMELEKLNVCLLKNKYNSEDFKKNFEEINSFSNICHGQAVSMGWHDKPREIGTDLMLIVSEVSEAMEGARKDLMDDHLPHRKMLEVELADAMIRIFDTAGKYGLDLGGAMFEKLKYNLTRADHQPENRQKKF